jgi:hypothetical protein
MVTGESFDERIERLTDMVELLGRQMTSLADTADAPEPAAIAATSDDTPSTVGDTN